MARLALLVLLAVAARADFSGMWTGFFGNNPVNDGYLAVQINQTVVQFNCLNVVSACSWNTATATIQGNGTAPNSISILLDVGTVILASANADGTQINLDNGSNWRKYTGALSGLWTGFWNHPLGDCYVIADGGQGTYNVWALSQIVPVGWKKGTGTYSGALVTVTLDGTTHLSGTLDRANLTMLWDNGSSWSFRGSQNLPPTVHTVHVVFMNHLDVGYNGIPMTGFINNILNIYFHEYFPRAILIANEMRALGGTDRFIYTTHPWLVSFFMDCPPNFILSGIQLQCPTPAETAAFVAAVDRGDIVWHAGPFNLQPENMDPVLFEAGLMIAQDLSDMFGKNRTRVLSQRDVPHMTRSVIPLLVKNGIIGITVGTNDACYPPQVPKAFIWRDEGTNTQILALEHPFGYGGLTQQDCVVAENGVGLCYAFRTDNSGPPLSTAEVIGNLDQVRSEYPEASVFASTYDAFMNQLAEVQDTLQVYTNEIGDTWMYGVPSDPLKMQQYREIRRVISDCIAHGECSMADPAFKNATRFLVKPPEHTWGLPDVYDGVDWSNPMFEAHKSGQNYLNCDAAWVEQRVFNEWTIQALEVAGKPLAAKIRAHLAALAPIQPDLTGFSPASPNQRITFAGQRSSLIVNAQGAVVSLIDMATGVDWASTSSPLAQFMYQTLNDTEYNAFCNDYMNDHQQNGGFAKPGSNPYTESAFWAPTLQNLWTKTGSASATVIAALTMPSITYTKFGAPVQVFLNITFTRNTTGALYAAIELQWFNKTATRLPESIMLNFRPAPSPVTAGSVWSMDKLGQPVDPMDVLTGGSQYQHGIWHGVTYHASAGDLGIDSLDVPVVSPMTPQFPMGNPLSYPMTPLPNQPFGMAFNMFNNLWNTNYILWYPYLNGDENSRFRFALRFPTTG